MCAQRERPQPLAQKRHHGQTAIVDAPTPSQIEEPTGIEPVIVKRELLARGMHGDKEPPPEDRREERDRGCQGQADLGKPAGRRRG